MYQAVDPFLSYSYFCPGLRHIERLTGDDTNENSKFSAIFNFFKILSRLSNQWYEL